MIFCLIHWCCLGFNGGFNHQTMGIPWYSGWFIDVVWDSVVDSTIKLWGYHGIRVDSLMLLGIWWDVYHQTVWIPWFSGWFIDVVWDLMEILTIKLWGYHDILVDVLIYWCRLAFKGKFHHQTLWIPWYPGWFIDVVWDSMVVLTIKQWGYHDILVDSLMLFVFFGALTIKLWGYHDFLVGSLMLVVLDLMVVSNYADTMIFWLIHWCCLWFNWRL